MYLFDTDIITNIFKKQPFSGLLSRLADTPRKQQFISTVTIAEIVYGAYKSDRPNLWIDCRKLVGLIIRDFLFITTQEIMSSPGVELIQSEGGLPFCV